MRKDELLAPLRGRLPSRIASALGRTRPLPHVLVLSHERPDGDAVGSCVALASMLRARGHMVDIVLPDTPPRKFRFLSGFDEISRPSDVHTSNGTVAFALDAADEGRLADGAELFRGASVRIVLDHHTSNTGFGDINWIDERASSVGEMLFRLSNTLSWRMPPEAREAIYVAILTDTGRFTFGNTTARALAAAAMLVRSGVDPEGIAENVYGRRTLGEWQLESRARESLRLELGGKLAIMQLSAADFEQTGTTPAAANDLAALTRTLDGVHMGLFLYEIDGGTKTKVGVRTTKAVDANRFATLMGGGGHKQAAGFTLEGSLEVSRKRLLKEAERFLNASRRARAKKS